MNLGQHFFEIADIYEQSTSGVEWVSLAFATTPFQLSLAAAAVIYVERLAGGLSDEARAVVS